MKRTYLITLFFALVLTSCVKKGVNQGLVSLNERSNIGYITSSSMLETSSERKTYSSSNEDAVAKLSQWSDSRHPTRAEISCNPEAQNCFRIVKALESFSIPVRNVPGDHSGINDVTLVYERLVARDCYEDLSSIVPISSGEVAYPYLGCAVARNTLEMVSDHNQFNNPKLSGLQDASRAVKSLKEED